MEQNHELYMQRCLEIASMGIGNTAPNPMVGALIIHKDHIIGEGYHRVYGEAHAEVNAIAAVEDKSLLKDSTLYVNLEPCSHYGKTPPCADLIVRSGIPRVIIGTTDPNPAVNGRGIAILKQAGCEVVTNVLKEECEALNKRFFTAQKYQRPYIILKWAETADHFIDKIRTPEEKPEWITNQASRILVHKWRSEEQAIMIGTETALMDNPRLNVRDWSGKNPVRIILDNHLRLPSGLNVFDGSVPTIVYTSKEYVSQKPNLQFVKMDFEKDVISSIISHLYCNKIQSILVEGGAALISSLLENNLWDEARVFQGKALFHNGIHAPKLTLKPVSEFDIDGVSLRFYNNKSLIIKGGPL